MSIPQYGDYQYEIYFDGLEGRLPKYPVDFASLERAAGEGIREVDLLGDVLHDDLAQLVYERLKRRPMVLPVVVEV